MNPSGDRDDDPQMVDDLGLDPGRDHGEQHRHNTGVDATAGRFRIVHEMKREDEQHRADEVGELRYGVDHFFTSSRGDLNILSIRSVMRKPLTMFVIEAKSAMAPRIRMFLG